MSDLAFVGVDKFALKMMAERQLPLGMSDDTYAEFCATLERALQRDGITDADVRIQGSSTHFFSGRHKQMPYRREDLFELFFSRHKIEPSDVQLKHFDSAITAQWPDAARRPLRRPFDVLHRIGLEASPSDYDVQISSDQALAIIEDELRIRRLDPSRIRIDHRDYNYVQKRFVENYFLYLEAWRMKAAMLVGRPVTIALFGASGPPVVDGNEGVSSHFRDEDWIVNLRSGS